MPATSITKYNKKNMISTKKDKKKLNNKSWNKTSNDNISTNIDELSKKLLLIKKKKIPKEEKMKEITFVINKCFYASNINQHILMKKVVLDCIHFCLKYGSDSQRCRIQELFEINMELFLASPRAKHTVLYLFKYANAARREFLVKLLSPKVSKLIVTKNLGNTLNTIFTQYLTSKQRYLLIKELYGKNFSVFEVNNPNHNLLDYAKDSIFESGLEDIKRNIILFSSKYVIHTPIIHYFLLKTHCISPKYFHTHLLPTIFDTCFDDNVIEDKTETVIDHTTNSFCSTHYGCELIARILHYQHCNRHDFIHYENNFLKIHKLIQKNLPHMLKFSGGLAIARTIINFDEYKEILMEYLWKPFVADISTYVGNENGCSQYILNLLESLAPQDSNINNHYQSYLNNFGLAVAPFSAICSTQSSDNQSSICIWNRNEQCDYYCSIINNQISQHFLKNASLILTEFNYGFTFAQWRPIINKNIIAEIYHQLIDYLNAVVSDSNVAKNNKCSLTSQLWINESSVPKVISRIISIENNMETLPVEETLSYQLMQKITNETKSTWLSHKNGVNLLLTLTKTSKPSTELSELIEYLKKENNTYFNSKF